MHRSKFKHIKISYEEDGTKYPTEKHLHAFQTFNTKKKLSSF